MTDKFEINRALYMSQSGRAGDWMQTYSGRQFWPVDPRPEEIYMEDIAAPLSKQCRYAGHCKRFYSVAEHCVLVASQTPEPFKLAALMHDASEAYLVDVPRPIKPSLSNYAEIENRLMRAIAERFSFEWPLPQVIKEIDNRILIDERDQNMKAPPHSWGLEHLKPLGVDLFYWTPAEAEHNFRLAFLAFGGAG